MENSTQSNNGTQVFLYLHTHWDREWYRSFEGYRFRLVQAMLSILTWLEQNPTSQFLLDGQTVVLEDYLALYPEQRELLQSLIQQQRLQVGPWYILPDEFLVSGEALIRNLQWGMSLADQFGQVGYKGYLPDMFGHVAQMPQLLKQCGLSPAIVWRGVNPSQSHFNWQALDGSVVPTLHLTKGYYQDAFFTAEPTPALLDFLTVIQAAAPDKSQVLLPVGGDHLGVPAQLAEKCRQFEADQPAYKLTVASLDAYWHQTQHLTAEAPVVTGELRDNAMAYVLPGVWSTRIYLKQANDQLQQTLERQVEPLLLWSWLRGNRFPKGECHQAWQYLLLNQPHDSICGCSIDEVHRDMEARFRGGNTLAEAMIQSAYRQLFGCPSAGYPGDQLQVLHFSPADFKGVIKTRLEFPEAHKVATFALFDEQGQEVPYDILSVQQEEKFVAEPDTLPAWEPVTRYHCALPMTLAGMGHQTLTIKPNQAPAQWGMAPLWLSNEGTLENEHVRVRVDKNNGQLHFDCREQGLWQPLLRGHMWLDGGDAGDEYNYSPPRHDRKMLAGLLDYEIEQRSYYQSLILVYDLTVPISLSPDREARYQDVKTHLRIKTRITLYEGDSTLYFETSLNNTARDHRLQLLMIPLTPNPEFWGSTVFGALPRSHQAETPCDVPKAKEWAGDTFPYEDWLHWHNDKNGVVMLTQGLHEASLLYWQEQPALAVTFLRAVGWLSRDDLRTRGGGAGPRMQTPEAQCLGPASYAYALNLAAPTRPAALQAVNNWRHPLLVVQGPQQPAMTGLFRINPPEVLLSALKKAEQTDAVILRVVNVLATPLELQISPLFDCRAVYRSNPLETHQEADLLNLTDGTLVCSCQPFEVLTLKWMPV